MSEYDAFDAMIDRTAREEQDDIDRKQGQFILDALTAGNQERDKGLSDLFNAAWRQADKQ
jgi:hypothetical protein